MKKFLILMIAMLMTSVVLPQNGSISVQVDNVLVEWMGTLKVGVYDQTNFPTEGKALFTIDMPVRGIDASIEFKDIPQGTYGIAVFQDINNDGALNRDMYRRPEEPYGFSQNKFGRFGPPKFKTVSFEVTEGDTTEMVIRLKH